MGRFCRCLGKIASCFCFASSSSKKKSSSKSSTPIPEDKISDPPNNCPANMTVDSRICHNAPTNAIANSIPDDIPIITRNLLTPPEPCGRVRHAGEELKIECISGARKEITVINWKVQDFLALCELKELLRNETCIFTAGHTLNKPTRWCFNLQRMKNEDNIGLFLKRIPSLPLKEIVGLGCSNSNDVQSMDNKENESRSLAITANNPNTFSNNTEEDDGDTVYIHYECIIRRSGHGDVWIHKRTCIPNFHVGQRLGFRKLFTLEELKTADELLKPKVPPLLGEDHTLHLEIKFTLHMKSIERSRSELDLMESFSLNWTKQYHAELLQEHLKYLLLSGINADLMLIIDADLLSDEKTFFVHKGILAARSPVFAAMFHSGMKESSSKVIRVKDVTVKAMHNVLSYIYTGKTDENEINWSKVSEVQELIYAADKYSVIGLRDFCDRMLISGCENENAMQLLYIANMHCLQMAVKEISLFIKMNANEIFSTGVSF